MTAGARGGACRVQINDVEGLERELPGALVAVREWLRVYKVPEGKPVNVFALAEAAMPAPYARRVVAATHAAWRAAYGAQRTISLPFTDRHTAADFPADTDPLATAPAEEAVSKL